MPLGWRLLWLCSDRVWVQEKSILSSWCLYSQAWRPVQVMTALQQKVSLEDECHPFVQTTCIIPEAQARIRKGRTSGCGTVWMWCVCLPHLTVNWVSRVSPSCELGFQILGTLRNLWFWIDLLRQLRFSVTFSGADTDQMSQDKQLPCKNVHRLMCTFILPDQSCFVLVLLYVLPLRYLWVKTYILYCTVCNLYIGHAA